MPIAPRLRPLAAACLAVAGLLAVAGPAAALEPPRPLPGYRAAFVTQTDKRPWTNCLWASAAMLLDKWTNGDVIRTHQQLRALSGDRRGGSTFEDLHVAFRKLGFRVPDHRAGDRLTWGQLLGRLKRGAGAIVLGDYADLPRWYGRWDYAFWRNRPERPPAKPGPKPVSAAGSVPAKPGAKPEVKRPPDNHAVYVERYDPRRGRVWLMDPLARGAWRGEWISVQALKRFAWTAGGAVYAVTTPVAAPAPFAGARVREDGVGLSSEALTATWRITAPRHWRYPGGDVRVSTNRAAAPLEAAARSAEVGPVVTAETAPGRPAATFAAGRLRITTALPPDPGAWVMAVSMTERRFGRRVVASDPVAVFVPGPRRATLRLNVLDDLATAGGSVSVDVSAANTGEATWMEAPGPDGDDVAPAVRTARERATRLVAHWIPLDDPARTAAPVAPLELLRLPLAPGELARFRGDLAVPDAIGRWALVVDVEDALQGSFAALGSAPAVAVFDTVAARGIKAVE